VAIARALAMQPEVILFDEPTSALDPRMAAEVEEVMADLASGGQTMVVVSHSLRLVRQAAHTVHVLEAGRIVESGAPAAVLDSPRHPATQRLLMEAVSEPSRSARGQHARLSSH
jgi:polar amino acid transport system ATP-binding protein